jgi:uncharacterized membrane protein
MVAKPARLLTKIKVNPWTARGYQKPARQVRQELRLNERIQVMDRMVAIVFTNEPQAYEGSRALQQLDRDGSIAVYASAVVTKNSGGKATVKQAADSVGKDTLTGTALGSLIGLLGGPVGLALGAASGALVGSVSDLDMARVDADFVNDVSEMLTPGKTALVAEIDEEWTTPLDTNMEAVGGLVFRRALADVIESQDQRAIDAIKADIAQMKVERAEAKAEHKQKLESRINALETKLQNKLVQAKAKREAIRREADARVEMLRAKAEQAREANSLCHQGLQRLAEPAGSEVGGVDFGFEPLAEAHSSDGPAQREASQLDFWISIRRL